MSVDVDQERPVQEVLVQQRKANDIIRPSAAICPLDANEKATTPAPTLRKTAICKIWLETYGLRGQKA